MLSVCDRNGVYSVQKKGKSGEDEFFWLDIPCEQLLQPGAEDNLQPATGGVSDNSSNNPQEVGRGAYGKVIPVNWMGQRLCAKMLHTVLKTIQPEARETGDTEEAAEENKKAATPLENFEREVTTWAARLKHTNVVQFMGGWQKNGQIAIIMERLEYNLTDLLERYEVQQNGLPTILKRGILSDVSAAMMYVHSFNIYHRDLTSNNVLLTSTLVAKVSDFGLAKFYENPHATEKPGTVHFLAPEADGKRYDKSIDVFSFGCVMLHLMTLEWPETVGEGALDNNEQPMYTPIERRWKHVQNLDENNPIEAGEFLPTIKDCLEIDFEKRPSFAALYSKLTSDEPATCMADQRNKIFLSWLEAEHHKSDVYSQTVESSSLTHCKKDPTLVPYVYLLAIPALVLAMIMAYINIFT